MAFTTEEKQIIDILEGGDTLIFKNIDLLVQNYEKKTAKKVNTGCPSCVRVMILTLKNIYKMTNFRFKRPAASYKNAKGDKTTISNATMTDEKALNFLKTNPERISLFSEYPSNWKKLIKGEIETEEQKKARIAAEAEKIEVKKAKKEKKAEKKTEKVVAEKTAEKVVEGASEKTETKTEEQKEENKTSEADRVELMKMSLSDLRKKYPAVKATSISAFVDKVLAL